MGTCIPESELAFLEKRASFVKVDHDTSHMFSETDNASIFVKHPK